MSFVENSVTRQLGAALSPDETCILTWTDRGVLHIWDASTVSQLAELHHSGMINGAARSADSRRILTWSYDHWARIWLVDLDSLLALAQSLDLRPLTNEERAVFFLPPVE